MDILIAAGISVFLWWRLIYKEWQYTALSWAALVATIANGLHLGIALINQ